ncbi:unnamed protein product [Moneuplotes crassus]|uniref:Uncharacterized protein n=1 Tax=Euplotes crassus TaxID=5936 RepID=A0AAD1Y0A0_EUPCR|nr:unnamed protein product [Moneuplotes crassus]
MKLFTHAAIFWINCASLLLSLYLEPLQISVGLQSIILPAWAWKAPLLIILKIGLFVELESTQISLKILKMLLFHYSD